MLQFQSGHVQTDDATLKSGLKFVSLLLGSVSLFVLFAFICLCLPVCYSLLSVWINLGVKDNRAHLLLFFPLFLASFKLGVEKVKKIRMLKAEVGTKNLSEMTFPAKAFNFTLQDKKNTGVRAPVYFVSYAAVAMEMWYVEVVQVFSESIKKYSCQIVSSSLSLSLCVCVYELNVYHFEVVNCF